MEVLQSKTRKQFVNAQRSDAAIAKDRHLIESASLPTTDELKALKPAVKAFAQLLPELVLRCDLLILQRSDKLTLFRST